MEQKNETKSTLRLVENVTPIRPSQKAKGNAKPAARTIIKRGGPRPGGDAA